MQCYVRGRPLEAYSSASIALRCSIRAMPSSVIQGSERIFSRSRSGNGAPVRSCRGRLFQYRCIHRYCSDHQLDRSAVAGGDVEQRIGLLVPVLGADDVADVDPVAEPAGWFPAGCVALDASRQPSCRATDDRCPVAHRHDPDGFVGRREAVEERDEQPAIARVLVRDERDGLALLEQFREALGCAEFVDQFDASGRPGPVEPVVQRFDVHRAIEGVHREAEHRHRCAEQFPVAAVPGDEQAGLVAEQFFEAGLHRPDLHVRRVGVRCDQLRAGHDFHTQREQMPIGLDRARVDAILIPVGEAPAQVALGTLQPVRVPIQPRVPARKRTGEPGGSLDAEHTGPCARAADTRVDERVRPAGRPARARLPRRQRDLRVRGVAGGGLCGSRSHVPGVMLADAGLPMKNGADAMCVAPSKVTIG